MIYFVLLHHSLKPYCRYGTELRSLTTGRGILEEQDPYFALFCKTPFMHLTFNEITVYARVLILHACRKLFALYFCVCFFNFSVHLDYLFLIVWFVHFYIACLRTIPCGCMDLVVLRWDCIQTVKISTSLG